MSMKKVFVFLCLCFGLTVQAQQVITVSQKAAADYSTIQAAIDACPENEWTIIRVSNGVYPEQLHIGTKQRPANKQISLIGESREGTVVTSAVGMKSHHTSFDKTPALSVYANDFYAENITFCNTSGKEGGQALAVYVAGDRQTFYHCAFKGWQDTHRTKKGTRSYYKECQVEGAVDFIYAGGTAWFERCDLHLIGNGYITAPEDISVKSGSLPLGFFFYACNLRRSGAAEPYGSYLGRPWGANNCGSIFMHCRLNDVIHEAGWVKMGDHDGLHSTFAEYQSVDKRGQIVDVSKRIGWGRQLTFQEYQQVNSWAKVDEAFRKSTNSSVIFDPEQVIANHHRPSGTLAFPTAEGFGKYASGGRGGIVVAVTNLQDDGEGSLRWALQQNGGKDMTIVFRVTGIITLKKDIRAKLQNVTIAGQTAPGLGILYRGGKLNFGGSRNLIIRNIRGRIGLRNDKDFIPGGSLGIENGEQIIVDHCCFGWSAEENITMYDNHFTTMQWCITHEGLYNAGHGKGARSYGAQWGGSPSTYHHNLVMNNYSRSPRLNGATNPSVDRNVFMEFFNNVNYNWGKRNSCYGGENEAGPGSTHECNFANNYYKPGPSTPDDSYFIEISQARKGKKLTSPSRWYFNGNVMEGEKKATADNWTAISNRTGFEDASLKSPVMLSTYHYDIYQTPMESAKKAYQSVLKKAGTIHRDAVEERIIRDVRQGKAEFQGETLKKAGFIDSPADAEDWPSYPEVTPEPDSDGDGMPDAWERSHGFNPQDKSDGTKVVSAEGYTALEVYLCELMGEKITIL